MPHKDVEARRAYRKQYQETHRVERLAYLKRYKEKNREQLLLDQKAYNKEHGPRRRQESRERNKAIRLTYLSGGCSKCPVSDTRVLEFDHIDRHSKKSSVADLVHSCAGEDRLVAEIAKCIVLCANCHRIKTISEKDYLHKSPKKPVLEKNKSVRAYNVRLRIANKRLLAEYMQGKHCLSCGFSDARALDFDHLDPSTKRWGIGSIIGSRTFDVVLSEIAKCQILCANCHRIKTIEKKQYRRPGGRLY